MCTCVLLEYIAVRCYQLCGFNQDIKIFLRENFIGNSIELAAKLHVAYRYTTNILCGGIIIVVTRYQCSKLYQETDLCLPDFLLSIRAIRIL